MPMRTMALEFRWWAHEKRVVGSGSPLIFDMACGASPSTSQMIGLGPRNSPQPGR